MFFLTNCDLYEFFYNLSQIYKKLNYSIGKKDRFIKKFDNIKISIYFIFLIRMYS